MRRAIAIAASLLVLGLVQGAGAAQIGQDRFFVTSDKVRLHYIEAGHGHTLVLVPGWSMPAWIFAPQIADLSRSYHVIAFDPRGQGDSDIPQTGYDQMRRGQDIAELLNTVAAEPVAVVAWSLGVLDTLAYVHAHGDRRLAALVLVDNSVGEDPPPLPPKRPTRPGPKLPREVMMRNFVRGMFRHPPPQPWLDRLTAAALRLPLASANALLAYPVPRTYWKQALYATSRPLLYLVRPKFSAQAGNVAAHHPTAETAVWQDVGHALFVDQAGRFNATLRDFLSRRAWK
jgi:microsomal epoxide hydrolase